MLMALNQELKLRERQLMSQNSVDKVLQETISYLTRVGDATSQLVNVTFLFGVNANESVSGRAHRLKTKHKPWKWVNSTLDFILSQDHCERAYFNDLVRAKKTIAEAEANE